MTLYGKVDIKEAFAVDEKLLRELEKMILDYYEDVEYKCTLCNEDKIEFDTLDELLGYENVSKRKIVSLEISFGYYNKIAFEKTISLLNSYKKTVECTFKTDDYDNYRLFQEKVKSILEKGKKSLWYTIVTKISLMHFSFFLMSVACVSLVYSIIADGWQILNANMGMMMPVAIIIATITIALSIIVAKTRNKLLPPICFMIGEQIKEIKKNENMCNNLFWGVFVTTIISILVTWIM